MKKLIILIILLLIPSCQQHSDIDEPEGCIAYGVQEKNLSQGEIASINELFDSEIIEITDSIEKIEIELSKIKI